MNNENLKKQHVRTQGRYSDTDLRKNRDKKYRVSPAAKDVDEKKSAKRYSSESRKSNNSLTEEHSSIKYEKDSNFSFSELEEHKKPRVISDRGKHIISSTENGESVIYYEPEFLDESYACDLFDCFDVNIPWNAKNIVIRGEEYPQPRLVAWYGPYPYSYSGTTLEAAEMPDVIITVKQKIETFLKDHGINAEFNSVLLNKYRNEKDSVSWHSDDELTMGICPTIASLSLGEVRRFEIRQKWKCHEENHQEPLEMFMNLNHGSLVVMDGCMQKDWQHRIPKEYHFKRKRINLTFRTVFPIDNSPCLSEKECTKQYAAAFNSTKTKDSRKLEYNDENFPALNNDVKTNWKKETDPSEFWDDCIPIDDKSWILDGNITHNSCDEKDVLKFEIENKSQDCTNANVLKSPDDTLKNDHSAKEMFHRNQFRRHRNNNPLNKQQNEKFQEKYYNDTESDLKQNDRFSRNHAERYSNRNLVTDYRKNEQLDRESVCRPNEKNEVPRSQFMQDEDKRWREENPRLRKKSQEKNSPIPDDYKIMPKLQDGDKKNERRKDYPLRNEKNEVPQSQFTQNEGRRWREENPRFRGRQERNFQIQDDDHKLVQEWENGDRKNERRNDLALRNGKKEVPRSQFSPNEDKRWREENPRFRGRQERNSQIHNDDHKIVPEWPNGDKRNNLPPRFGFNKRNIPHKIVKDENNSEPSNNSKHASKFVKKEHSEPNPDKKHSNNTLNVAANEFVPKWNKPICDYNEISLKELLFYEINLMCGENLQNYAENLKDRVLEIFDEFQPDEREELEFLCAITDGSQVTKNQRMISTRMANIAVDYVDRKNLSQ